MDKELRKREHDRVLRALVEEGFPVTSLNDLLRKGLPRTIFPVLAKLLPTIRDEWIKQGVVRGLTEKAALNAAAKPLLNEFKRPDAGHGLKWAIGNALSVMADDSLFDQLAELVQDPSHGKSREMLAVALGNMKKRRDEAVVLLKRLLKDEQVAGHSLIALKKLRGKEAREEIRSFLDHPKAWIRKEAKTTLQRLEQK